MKMVEVYPAALRVVPDATTPGSEGRLCLQLPEALEPLVGRKFRAVGNFSRDDYVMMIEGEDGKTVTPHRQVWWKNGVRDHNIRRHFLVEVYMISTRLWVVALAAPTNEPPPILPPHQELLFE